MSWFFFFSPGCTDVIVNPCARALDSQFNAIIRRCCWKFSPISNILPELCSSFSAIKRWEIIFHSCSSHFLAATGMQRLVSMLPPRSRARGVTAGVWRVAMNCRRQATTVTSASTRPNFKIVILKQKKNSTAAWSHSVTFCWAETLMQLTD